MNLESDKRLNIQLRLDFSSTPTGEARQAGREDIESLLVVNEPERPANTNRIMEEVCERANQRCGCAGGCSSSTKPGVARAGPIHSRIFTGTLGSYAWAGLGTTCRG